MYALPPRVVLYTIDQISDILQISTSALMAPGYVHFDGRSPGARTPDLMLARNVAPSDHKPEWRIADTELIRWMKRKGFRFYERGAVWS